MRLLFDGGPWDNQLLDSAVTSAPECVAPDCEKPGVYVRTDRQPDPAVVTYTWSPTGTEDRV